MIGRALLVGLLLLGGAVGCTSASGTDERPDCYWRATSDVSDIALSVSHDRGETLLGFDPDSGALVGRCAFGAGYFVQPPLAGGGQNYVGRGYQFSLPAVAGSRLTVVPDGRGVRDVHTGQRSKLRFTGWAVVSAVGDRLLLARKTAGQTAAPTDPASWCVLPKITSARSACAPIPGADAPGAPAVTPDGSIGWTPKAGRSVRLGRVAGYLGTDGAGSVSGFAPEQTLALLVPASVDQRNIVFLPNTGGPHPTGRPTLQWVHFDGGLHGTVRDTGITDDSGGAPRFDATTVYGLAVSPDGRSLVALESDCLMYRATAAGAVTTLPRLHGPRDLGCGTLLRWPFRSAET